MRAMLRRVPIALRALGLAVLLGVTATALLLWWRPLMEFEAEYVVFGTHARVRLLALDPAQAEAALAQAGQQLAADHRSWHAWEPSDLTALNADLAAGHSRQVDPALANLVREAKRGHALSDGLFNPAAGKLIRAWGFHTSEYPVRTAAPADDELARLQANPPTMKNVHVSAQGEVRSDNPLVQLDLNALAEGYAAKQLRSMLEQRRIENALLDIGGLIMAIGDDRGQPWQVGVRGPDGAIGHVLLQDGETLSSSGDYQRRRADPGKAEGHIIDTARGRPQQRSAAATIISHDPVLADMAGTTLMVAGPERFDVLAHRMGLRCAMLLTHDGRLLATPTMQRRLKLRAGYHFQLPSTAPAGAQAGDPPHC